MNVRAWLAALLVLGALFASSAVTSAPAEASHGPAHAVTVRIVARLGDDGRVEFALQRQGGNGTWDAVLYPRARYYPANAPTSTWLVSSVLIVRSVSHERTGVEMRIVARRGDDRRIEFGMQQLFTTIQGGVVPEVRWGSVISPRARYFPTRATAGRWLASTPHVVFGTVALGALPDPNAPATPAPPDPGIATDRLTLIAFYNATGGRSWTTQTNWKSNLPLGLWHGVRVGDDGRVTRLRLEGNNLTGGIPPAIRNLARLERIDLSNNDMRGAIPAAIGDLARLERIDLANNEKMGGRIPIRISRLSNLTHLNLTSTAMTGSIPSSIGVLRKLEQLILDDNELTGSLPAGIGNLVDLEVLVISDNSLTGTFPIAAIAKLTNLNILRTHGNNIAGCLPLDIVVATDAKVDRHNDPRLRQSYRGCSRPSR